MSVAEDHKARVAALNCLAGGLGRRFRNCAAVWPVPPCPGAAQRGYSQDLDQVLRLILGEQLGPPPTVLYSSDNKPVEVALDELPPPSRLRTLQENIFARAAKLYELAGQASFLTALQELLERDLAGLQEAYAAVTRQLPDREAPRIRDLLGDPQLKPVAGKESGATIEVKDEVHFAMARSTARSARACVSSAEYYVRFDEYDQMSFPLYYDTGTGEPSTVEILRVSPEDARGLIDERYDPGNVGRQRRKLAGTALFNFGAFLDVRWRRNDIMWGRLDGCERLLAALFPEDADTSIRKALLQEAHRTILREEMQPEEYAVLARFAEALVEQQRKSRKRKVSGRAKGRASSAKVAELKQAFEKL
jgi:hypothetical protein